MSHRLTILEMVQAVMASGNFVKAPCYLAAGEEDEIGLALDDYEKAIYTVLINVNFEYNKRVDRVNSGTLNEEEKIDEFDYLYVLEKKIFAISELLWVDIKERIIDEKIDCDIDRLGVGNRFEVVENSSDEDDENPDDECYGVDVVEIRLNPAFKGIFSGSLLFQMSARPEEN
jgi:hypothetical protein